MDMNVNALWCVISEMSSSIPWWFSTIINPHDWKQVACNEWQIQGKVRLLLAVTAGKRKITNLSHCFPTHIKRWTDPNIMIKEAFS